MEGIRKVLVIWLSICVILTLVMNFEPDSHQTARASTINVGPGQTYTTIQEGIDAAKPGDTIYVYAGIYYENVIVNKTINLIGEGKENTIVNGNGSGNVIYLSNVNFVNITGLGIMNSGDFFDGGIRLTSSSNNTIYNNSVFSNKENGIYLTNSSNNLIFNNDIFNNSMHGLIISSSNNNAIENNKIHDNFGYNILLNSMNNNTVRNNFLYNSSIGIRLSESIECVVAGNDIHNHSTNGIQIFSSSANNYISENEVYNNGWAGIYQSHSHENIIINNSFYNNTEDGIKLWKSNGNYYINNAVFNNLDRGISISESSDNFFINCEIIINTDNIRIYTSSEGIYFINSSILNSLNADLILDTDSHAIAINTTFNETSVHFNDDSSTFTVQWYLNVKVKDMEHIAISDADIEVYNIYDDLVASGKSDRYGRLNWIITTERIQNHSSNITHTPHNVSALKDSCIGFAIPEPLMESNKQINISLNYKRYLHHIEIIQLSNDPYYIDDFRTYTAIGWNDAAETQLNTTWIPVWSVDNVSIASIDSITGEFVALELGSGIINVTALNSPIIYNTSPFIIEPWPLHHIVITPSGPNRHYIGEEITYTAVGWNDANEIQQNMTWIPFWSVNNISLSSINSVTGIFTGKFLGSGIINVTSIAPTGVFNTSSFTIEPWPLHHIEIIPSGLERYYIGNIQTYTAIGWNDANETQMNISWTPIWIVDNTSTASIDPASGDFTALALGSSNVKVSASSLPQISNSSSFTVDSWPLHHIELIPGNSGNYYIGDTNTYRVIGWNDEAKTQENSTWIPVWSIENTTLATIDDSGFFTAIALGNSVINVSSTSNPLFFSNITFTIHPWPLHHIQILPRGPQTFTVGDIYSYTVIGWNDVQATQINTTWTPVWRIEGDLEEFTWEGEEARFEVITSGEGTLICEDEATGISASSEIFVRKEPQGPDSTWVWTLIAIIFIMVILMIFLIFWKNRKDKDDTD